MRVLLRKRYYCDHCKKAGGGKAAMEKHEASCTNNPQRVCRMCKLLDQHGMRDGIEDFEQAPLADLKAAYLNEGFPALRKKSGDCPVCMLAAMRQTTETTEDGWPSMWEERDPRAEGLHGWDFKAACKEIMDGINEARDDRYY